MNTFKKTDGKPFTVRENWDSQSKALKAVFSSLTDQDLKFETGKEDELIERLSTKLNKNREEVITILNKGVKINKN